MFKEVPASAAYKNHKSTIIKSEALNQNEPLRSAMLKFEVIA